MLYFFVLKKLCWESRESSVWCSREGKGGFAELGSNSADNEVCRVGLGTISRSPLKIQSNWKKSCLKRKRKSKCVTLKHKFASPEGNLDVGLGQ